MVDMIITCFLTLISGFSVIIISFVIYVKDKNDVVMSYLIAYAGVLLFFICAIAAESSSYRVFPALLPMLSIVKKAFLILRSILIFLFPYFFHYMLDVRFIKIKNSIFTALTLFSIALIFIFSKSPEIPDRVSFILFFLSFLYIIILFIKTKKYVLDPKIKKLQIVYIVLMSHYFLIIAIQFILQDFLIIKTFIIKESVAAGIIITTWNIFFIHFLSSHIHIKHIGAPGIKQRIDIFPDHYNLTDREKEIINLLINGYSYSLIAEQKFISPLTVKTHIRNIYAKLNIKNKYQLINLFLPEKKVIKKIN
jgi:DNA-binding CsgD family transcriptional regulator